MSDLFANCSSANISQQLKELINSEHCDFELLLSLKRNIPYPKATQNRNMNQLYNLISEQLRGKEVSFEYFDTSVIKNSKLKIHRISSESSRKIFERFESIRNSHASGSYLCDLNIFARDENVEPLHMMQKYALKIISEKELLAYMDYNLLISEDDILNFLLKYFINNQSFIEEKNKALVLQDILNNIVLNNVASLDFDEIQSLVAICRRHAILNRIGQSFTTRYTNILITQETYDAMNDKFGDKLVPTEKSATVSVIKLGVNEDSRKHSPANLVMATNFDYVEPPK